MPLTLAIAGSSVVSTAMASVPLEEFFEQEAAGRSSSASAAAMVNFRACGATASGLLGVASFSVIMARSLIGAGAAGNRRPDSREIAPPLQWPNIGPNLTRSRAELAD